MPRLANDVGVQIVREVAVLDVLLVALAETQSLLDVDADAINWGDNGLVGIPLWDEVRHGNVEIQAPLVVELPASLAALLFTTHMGQ